MGKKNQFEWYQPAGITVSIICHIALVAILFGFHPFEEARKTPRRTFTNSKPTSQSFQSQPPEPRPRAARHPNSPVSAVTIPIAPDQEFPPLLKE